MRTPHLATAILAVGALGGSYAAEHTYTLNPSPNESNALVNPLRKNRIARGSVTENQRKRRKNRRRAWAAGNRKAFTR